MGERSAAARLGLALLTASALAGTGCGIEKRGEAQPHAVFAELRGLPSAQRSATNEPTDGERTTDPFAWPTSEIHSAEIVVGEHGAIGIELYPGLAPQTVANFEKLARDGFYDGTTFHRVIPGFMIQGGDPNTRDDDPSNDGKGGPGYTIDDEFSDAPFEAGVIAMANRGSPNTGGAQFFIVHETSPHLAGKYTAFGRVVSGFEHVDAIARSEADETGRWGPRNRPLENVVIETVRVGPNAAADAPR